MLLPKNAIGLVKQVFYSMRIYFFFLSFLPFSNLSLAFSLSLQYLYTAFRWSKFSPPKSRFPKQVSKNHLWHILFLSHIKIPNTPSRLISGNTQEESYFHSLNTQFSVLTKADDGMNVPFDHRKDTLAL